MFTEAVVRMCSVKKVILKISQNSQENTCARVSFFNKVASLRPATLLKKRLWHRCFPVNFAKSLRTPFLTEHLRWLLLCSEIYHFIKHKVSESTYENITIKLISVEIEIRASVENAVLPITYTILKV